MRTESSHLILARHSLSLEEVEIRGSREICEDLFFLFSRDPDYDLVEVYECEVPIPQSFCDLEQINEHVIMLTDLLFRKGRP